MRICSRCNNEVRKTDLVCSKCGFSLLRDKYGKRISYPMGTIKNLDIRKDNDSFKNNNIRSYLAVIIILTSIIIPIITGIFLSSEDEKIDNPNDITSKNIDEVINYTDYIKLQALDYYNVLELINNGEVIDLNKIEEVTSLSIDDMTNESCINMLDSEDALVCVLNTHQLIGTYEIANEDMADFYDYVYYIDDSDMKDILIELYNNTYDLYYLPGNEENFTDYELNYSRLTIDINELIESLNNLGI